MSDLRPDFGDVTGEYRAARAGSGFTTGTLSILWAAGSDAVSFLDGQLSQDLPAMGVGTVARALLLEPRGKLVAPGWVLRGGDEVGFVVDAGVADQALERLTSFMFRVDVELRLEAASTHVLWGRDAAATASGAGLDPGTGWQRHGERIAALLPGAVLDRVIVTGDDDPLRAAGAIPIGSVAWSTVRIEAGEPVMGVDVDDSTIPQESGLVDASVSFTKGCYVGQELVARIDSRGRVNRRLVGITMTTNVVPPVGSQVVADGESRGTLTSVGESLTLRAPVAMAMLRREAEDGSTVRVEWDGGAAEAIVHPLPLDDFSDPPHTSRTRQDDGGHDHDGDVT